MAAVLLGGCKVEARVDVTLRADGSGTVRARIALDADAVHRLTTHSPLATAVPLADVRAAGWHVSAWTPVAGGGDAITFTRGFVGQRDLARRLSDLVGTTGVLRDPQVARTRDWFRAKDSIALTVDLSHLSTGIRFDAQVVKALANAGVDVNALDAQLQSQLGQALTMTAAVHAPGGQVRTITVTPGKQATVSASTAQTYTRRIVLLIVGAALLVLALLLTAGSLAARSRRRRVS